MICTIKTRRRSARQSNGKWLQDSGRSSERVEKHISLGNCWVHGQSAQKDQQADCKGVGQEADSGVLWGTTRKIWIVLWISWLMDYSHNANAQQDLWELHICWIVSFLSSKPFMASNWTDNGIPTLYPVGMTGPCFPPALTSCHSPHPLSSCFPPCSFSLRLYTCLLLAWECSSPWLSPSWRVMLKCHILKKPPQSSTQAALPPLYKFRFA